jgi:hypothetical protein
MAVPIRLERNIARQKATFADALAEPAWRDGERVATQGYAVEGDGGADEYFYRASGWSGLTPVEQTLSGFYKQIGSSDAYLETVDKTVANVLAFGAPTDGSDASATFQLALAAADNVRVPKASYTFTQPCVIDESNKRLMLDENATINYAVDASQVFEITGDNVTIEGGTISDASAYASTPGSTVRGVISVQGENAIIRNVRIPRVPRYGINFYRVSGGTVENCYIDGGIPVEDGFPAGFSTAHAAINIEPGVTGESPHVIRNNRFINCMAGILHGAYVVSAQKEVLILNNVFENLYDHCVYHGNSSNTRAVIEGNFALNARGWTITGNTGSVVRGNTIATTADEGSRRSTGSISCRDTSNAVIEDNIINCKLSSGFAFIDLTLLNDFPILNNTIRNNHCTTTGTVAVYGIRLTATEPYASNVIGGNIITGNELTTTAGVAFTGAIYVATGTAGEPNIIEGNNLDVGLMSISNGIDCQHPATIFNNHITMRDTRTHAEFTTDYLSNANQLASVGHGYSDDDIVQIASTDTLPGGLMAKMYYYIINSTSDTLELATTSGGTPITLTSDGSGTHTIAQILTVAGISLKSKQVARDNYVTVPDNTGDFLILRGLTANEDEDDITVFRNIIDYKRSNATLGALLFDDGATNLSYFDNIDTTTQLSGSPQSLVDLSAETDSRSFDLNPQLAQNKLDRQDVSQWSTSGTAISQANDHLGRAAAIRVIATDTVEGTHIAFRDIADPSLGDYLQLYVKKHDGGGGGSAGVAGWLTPTGGGIGWFNLEAGAAAATNCEFVGYSDIGSGWFRAVWRITTLGSGVLWLFNGVSSTNTPADTTDGIDYFVQISDKLDAYPTANVQGGAADGALVPLLRGVASAATPDDPQANEYIVWMDSATGDLKAKITDSGGTTKTHTLADFSAL